MRNPRRTPATPLVRITDWHGVVQLVHPDTVRGIRATVSGVVAIDLSTDARVIATEGTPEGVARRLGIRTR